MITKEAVKNVFGAAGCLMPALDRVVHLFLSSVDNSTLGDLSAKDLAMKAVEWYMDAAVTDEVVKYLNDNLEYYPVVEFLKASLDEYTIFQMLVSFNGINSRKRVWKGQLIPATAESRLVKLGSFPHDTKGDIYIGLQGKTTAYKYDYGAYNTYMSENGKLIFVKETIVQDMDDEDNHLIIRAVVPNDIKKISIDALDAVVDERFRGLYAN